MKMPKNWSRTVTTETLLMCGLNAIRPNIFLNMGSKPGYKFLYFHSVDDSIVTYCIPVHIQSVYLNYVTPCSINLPTDGPSHGITLY